MCRWFQQCVQQQRHQYRQRPNFTKPHPRLCATGEPEREYVNDVHACRRLYCALLADSCTLCITILLRLHMHLHPYHLLQLHAQPYHLLQSELDLSFAVMRPAAAKSGAKARWREWCAPYTSPLWCSDLAFVVRLWSASPLLCAQHVALQQSKSAAWRPFCSVL